MSKAPPLQVSILINNYNYGRFLGQAIASALDQTHADREVVVVDDGSTDESRAVIESFGDSIVAVFKENGGQGSAYNAGFTRASGDILMFLDSDDLLLPFAVERICEKFRTGSMIVHHRLEMIDTDGQRLGRFWPSAQYPLDSGDVLPILLKTGLYSAPPSSGLAYSRALLERFLPVPEEIFRISADTWLVLNTPFHAPVDIIDETLALYRVHGGNSWGPLAPTRRTTRQKIEKEVAIRRESHALIAREAASRHLEFDVLDWDNVYMLRWQLCLMRLQNPPAPFSVRWRLVKKIWRLLRTESFTPLVVVKESLLALVVHLAPKVLLRLIFPNLF